MYFIFTGKKSRPMHIPETSSITTREGSLPHIFSTMVDDHMPVRVIKTVITMERNKGG